MDYVIQAEAAVVKEVKETISDSLLIVTMLNGLSSI